jgi:hypothetical protein
MCACGWNFKFFFFFWKHGAQASIYDMYDRYYRTYLCTYIHTYILSLISRNHPYYYYYSRWWTTCNPSGKEVKVTSAAMIHI